MEFCNFKPQILKKFYSALQEPQGGKGEGKGAQYQEYLEVSIF